MAMFTHYDQRYVDILRSTGPIYLFIGFILGLPLLNYKNDHNNNNNIKRNIRNVAGWPQQLTPIIAVPY